MEIKISGILYVIGVLCIIAGIIVAVSEDMLIFAAYGIISGSLFCGFAAMISMQCRMFDEIKRQNEYVERKESAIEKLESANKEISGRIKGKTIYEIYQSKNK